MKEFKEYRIELKPITEEDIALFKIYYEAVPSRKIFSISDADLENGSPKIGDILIRNPNNHNDQWLISVPQFKNNFEPLVLWHSVKNKLPKNGDCVWVPDKTTSKLIRWRIGDQIFHDYWQEAIIPKPPKDK